MNPGGRPWAWPRPTVYPTGPGAGNSIPQTAVFDTAAKPTRWPTVPVPNSRSGINVPAAVWTWGKRQVFWYTAAIAEASILEPTCPQGRRQSLDDARRLHAHVHEAAQVHNQTGWIGLEPDVRIIDDSTHNEAWMFLWKG